MKDNISVALATYNGAKYIEEQLVSLINQSLLPCEIIIIDDFSTDNTFEILKEIQKNYPLILLYRNDENIGPIETFKKAIKYCNSEYIALCDQDDIWELNKIELSFNEIKKMNQSLPSIVFTDLKMIDAHGSLIGDSFWKTQGYNPKKTKFSDLLISNVVTGCTIMMNGKMKKEIEKMPNKVIMHDYWIALIAFSLGCYKIIDSNTIKFRVHVASVTDKSKISIFARIKLAIGAFTGSQIDYKCQNILQAEYFFNIYKERLSKENSREILRFLSLKNKSTVMKKIYVGYLKYFSF
ncbi:MAG: glycosyltransferase family 2 protein [Flavobacterium sp.]